jgi:hypothetical protein
MCLELRPRNEEWAVHACKRSPAAAGTCPCSAMFLHAGSRCSCSRLTPACTSGKVAPELAGMSMAPLLFAICCLRARRACAAFGYRICASWWEHTCVACHAPTLNTFGRALPTLSLSNTSATLFRRLGQERVGWAQQRAAAVMCTLGVQDVQNGCMHLRSCTPWACGMQESWCPRPPALLGLFGASICC